MLFYRWENVSKHRYYMTYLSQDLLDDWVVTRIWGSKSKNLGRIRYTAFLSLAEAQAYIDRLKEKRIKMGYQLTASLLQT